MLKLSYKIDKLINKCNYNTKAILQIKILETA